MKLSDIKSKKIFEGFEITNEIIRPVAEKWEDGEVRATDNLQLTIRSVGSKNIKEVYAYLYYYDENGKELGHEFDFPESPIKPGNEARLSFMIIPPENWSYTALEIKAEYESKNNYMVSILLFAIAVIVIYGLQYLSHA